LVNLYGCKNIGNKLTSVGIDTSNFVRVALGFVDLIGDAILYVCLKKLVLREYWCST